MFSISWLNVKSALVSALITAILAMASYIIGVGDIFHLDSHSLVNIGVLAALTTVVSLIKSFLTNENGTFVGSVQVK